MSEFCLLLVFWERLPSATLESSALRRRPGTWGPGRVGVPESLGVAPLPSALPPGLEEGPGLQGSLPSGWDGRGRGRRADGTWARGAGVPGGEAGVPGGPGRCAEPRGGGDGGGGGSRVRIRVPARPRLQGRPSPCSRPYCLTPRSLGTLLPPRDSSPS